MRKNGRGSKGAKYLKAVYSGALRIDGSLRTTLITNLKQLLNAEFDGGRVLTIGPRLKRYGEDCSGTFLTHGAPVARGVLRPLVERAVSV